MNKPLPPKPAVVAQSHSQVGTVVIVMLVCGGVFFGGLVLLALLTLGYSTTRVSMPPASDAAAVSEDHYFDSAGPTFDTLKEPMSPVAEVIDRELRVDSGPTPDTVNESLAPAAVNRQVIDEAEAILRQQLADPQTPDSAKKILQSALDGLRESKGLIEADTGSLPQSVKQQARELPAASTSTSTATDS